MYSFFAVERHFIKTDVMPCHTHIEPNRIANRELYIDADERK